MQHEERTASLRGPLGSTTSVPVLVSVIIPTRNSAATLERCLRSLRQQTYPRIESVVVDNSSKDQTRDIATRLADRVASGGPERSAQRNQGAQLASGNYLLFIDADMELSERVVEDCVLRMAGCDALIIPEVTLGESWVAKVRRIERESYRNSYLFEAARLVRKDVFETLGGYETRLTGLEDYDFEAKLEEHGYAVGHAEEEILHHEENLDLGRFLRKRAYYAQGLQLYAQLHPTRAPLQFGVNRILFYARKSGMSTSAMMQVIALKALEHVAILLHRVSSPVWGKEQAGDVYSAS